MLGLKEGFGITIIELREQVLVLRRRYSEEFYTQGDPPHQRRIAPLKPHIVKV